MQCGGDLLEGQRVHRGNKIGGFGASHDDEYDDEIHLFDVTEKKINKRIKCCCVKKILSLE